MVASDHDHPDSSPLACAYRIRNVASRRVLQPGQTQERQGLERRTIRHRSCERRERKDTQTFPAKLCNTLEPFRSCRFIHNGITVFAREALRSCEHRFGSALDGKKVNPAAAVNGGHHVGACVEGMLNNFRTFVQQLAALQAGEPAGAQERELHGIAVVLLGDATERGVVAEHRHLEKPDELKALNRTDLACSAGRFETIRSDVERRMMEAIPSGPSCGSR